MTTHTVRKVTKGEEIRYHEINKGRILGISTIWNVNGWVVIDENGTPVTITDRMTGKEEIECYPLKRTAIKVADWHSR